MKKALIALVLASGVAAVAYASLHNRSSNKQAVEKKESKESKKKECKRSCLFG